MPQELRFTKDHEWVRLEGNIGTVGISEHAAHELGDITFLDLPKVGKDVKQGQAFSSVESVKAANDIYSPVSGKIIDVNKSLESAPELINQEAYNKGWICKVECSKTDEANTLMTQEQYDAYLKDLH